MADSTLHNLTLGSAIVGTEETYGVQSPFGAGDDRRWTWTQVKTWTSASPALVTPNLGIPSAGTLTNCTIPVGQLTSAGTGVLTALGVNVGSAGAFVTLNGALGTPSSGVATNLTGTASGLTAGNVTTNANLTGVITSVGNATSIASQTGTGTKFVVDTSPTLVTPLLGTPTSGTLTNCTGLPEGGLSLTNITTNDVSITKHGFAPILPNDATKFLNGVGAYAVPAGSGGSSSGSNLFESSISV